MHPKSIAIGLVIGAIIAVVVGFKFMGWKTRFQATEAATVAMKQSAACVAKFAKAPDYAARTKELSGKYAFEVAPYLDKAGFTKAEPPAQYPVGEACAAGIEVLVGADKPAATPAAKPEAAKK